MSNNKKTEVWVPCDDFTLGKKKYGIMVLNTPVKISCNQLFIKNLWNKAKVRITVDGGTEKWLQWMQTHKCDPDDYQYPDLITGDMDSLPKDVLNYFISRNDQIKVIVTPDQDETDFHKALKELSVYCIERNIELETVFVLVDSSGRLDQILANLNTLFRSSKLMGDIKIFLLGADSMTWLLPQGDHIIHIPSCLRENQEWCSLLPIGGPCIVTTTGLKWNLNNDKLSFGELVSSSNTYDGSPSIYVRTDNPLIWSMSIQSLLAT